MMTSRTIEINEIGSKDTFILIGSKGDVIDFSRQAITMKVYYDNQSTPTKLIDLMFKTHQQPIATVYELKIPKGTKTVKLGFQTRDGGVDLSLLEYELSEV